MRDDWSPNPSPSFFDQLGILEQVRMPLKLGKIWNYQKVLKNILSIFIGLTNQKTVMVLIYRMFDFQTGLDIEVLYVSK
jgi:hypothetical protein